MRRAGHRVINICEENIVYPDGLDYCQRKVGREALAEIDLMPVTGRRNLSHLREFRPEGATKYVLTGNARFDTLMPGFREVYASHTAKLRQRFGRFLLVNTNFSRVNHFHQGRDVLARMEKMDQIADAEHAAYYHDLFDYKRRQIAALRALLAEVAARKVFDTIVVRPHPSENQDTWRAWAQPFGVEVRYELTANDWLLACDAFLHTGCTTGMEGLLLDRPVASFMPEPGHNYFNQADEVSVPVTDTDEFLARSAEWRAMDAAGLRARFAGERKHLATMIENVDPPLAADRIVAALDGLDVPAAPADFGRRRSQREVLAATVSWAQRTLSRFRGAQYSIQKLPGIDESDVREPLEIWARQGLITYPEIVRMADSTWLFRRGGRGTPTLSRGGDTADA
jgi:surface carbohydrate biosynthesis protein